MNNSKNTLALTGGLTIADITSDNNTPVIVAEIITAIKGAKSDALISILRREQKNNNFGAVLMAALSWLHLVVIKPQATVQSIEESVNSFSFDWEKDRTSLLSKLNTVFSALHWLFIENPELEINTDFFQISRADFFSQSLNGLTTILFSIVWQTYTKSSTNFKPDIDSYLDPLRNLLGTVHKLFFNRKLVPKSALYESASSLATKFVDEGFVYIFDREGILGGSQRAFNQAARLYLYDLTQKIFTANYYYPQQYRDNINNRIGLWVNVELALKEMKEGYKKKKTKVFKVLPALVQNLSAKKIETPPDRLRGMIHQGIAEATA